MFAFRALFKKFGDVWTGMWRDENYTYIIDGTKETNKETSVDWDVLNYTKEFSCSSIGVTGQVEESRCIAILRGLCEKPWCV